MASFSTLGNFRESAGGVSVDPRLMDILKTAASVYGLDVQATSGVAGRSTGTKNHPGGFAVDLRLVDPSSGKVFDNYHGDLKGSFPVYEQFAQTARIVQQQKYPELASKFRWGGYFAGGPNPADLMHFDINPKMNGAMGGGSWDRGAKSDFAKAYGVTSNGGLATANGQRQVAAITRTLAGNGPMPPTSIGADTAQVMPAAMPARIAAGRGQPSDADIHQAMLRWADPSTPLPASFGVGRADRRLDVMNPGADGQAFFHEPSMAMLPPSDQIGNPTISLGTGKVGAGNLLDPRTAAVLAPQQRFAAPTLASTRAEQMAMRSPTPPALDRRNNGLVPPSPSALPPMVPPSPNRLPALPAGPIIRPPAQIGAVAPVPMPGRPVVAQAAAMPPALMPGRPAALQSAAAPVSGRAATFQPQAAQPAMQRQAQPAQQLVRLANGGMIPVGITQGSNGPVNVTDDGTGRAVITKIRNPGAIPGLIDPIKEASSPTLAGAFIRAKIPEVMGGAVQDAQANLGYAGDTVKSSAADAANAVGQGVQGAFNSVTSFLGGFGGGQPSRAPAAVRAPTVNETMAEQRMTRPNYVSSTPAPAGGYMTTGPVLNGALRTGPAIKAPTALQNANGAPVRAPSQAEQMREQLYERNARALPAPAVPPVPPRMDAGNILPSAIGAGASLAVGGAASLPPVPRAYPIKAAPYPANVAPVQMIQPDDPNANVLSRPKVPVQPPPNGVQKWFQQTRLGQALAPPPLLQLPVMPRWSDNAVGRYFNQTNAGKLSQLMFGSGSLVGPALGRQMPQYGQTIQTENSGQQIVGHRLNDSPKGRTVTNDAWFNAVRGL